MPFRLIAVIILLGVCQPAKSQAEPLETGAAPNGVPIYYQTHGMSEKD